MFSLIKRFSLLAGIMCLGFALATTAWAVPPHPPGKAAESKNMRLVGHNDLQARSTYKGHVQEQNGRFIVYAGHHGGEAFNPLTGVVEPNGLSIVDVTDPSNPVYLRHLHANEAPGAFGFNQSRNLQTCAGADLPSGTPGEFYLHREVDNARHELWNVTDPENPVFMAVIQGGLNGTHKNWWECSTGILYATSEVPGWETRHLSIFDLSDPENPVFIRNWIGLPGAQPGAPALTGRDTSIHEPLYLDDKVYMAYGTRADGILQIVDNDVLLTNCVDPNPCATNPSDADLTAPIISQLDWPDFQGVHSAVPLLDMDVPEFDDFNVGTPRDMVAVVNESTRNECNWDMHQMVYMVDITDPVHPIPVSTFFVPEESGNFCERGGRFGAHSTQWNLTEEHYRNRIIWVSYFNAGVRGVDIRDPYNPKEVAYYIPAITENTTPRDGKFAIQTNNVDVDDRGFVYIFDRANTGLHILEPTGQAKKIAGL